MSRPSASASWIMRRAARSFTLPPGFANSSFARPRRRARSFVDAPQAHERRVADGVDDRLDAAARSTTDLAACQVASARAGAASAAHGRRGRAPRARRGMRSHRRSTEAAGRSGRLDGHGRSTAALPRRRSSRTRSRPRRRPRGSAPRQSAASPSPAHSASRADARLAFARRPPRAVVCRDVPVRRSRRLSRRRSPARC